MRQVDRQVYERFEGNRNGQYVIQKTKIKDQVQQKKQYK